MSGDFVPAVYESGSVPEVFVVRDPKMVIKEAENAAKALMEVVRRKPKEDQVIINKKQYLEFPDWQTVANFYGCTVKVRATAFLDYGGVKGFEAFADVVNRNGIVISSGEGMCLNDEEKWGMRTKYEWKDKLDSEGKKIWNKNKNRYEADKVKVGEEPTPLFQLRSMAQTRACAKALRNVFSWVVVLAGYAPVAAEEMTGSEGEKEKKPPISPPQEKKENGTATGDAATEPQVKKINAMLGGLGYKKDDERHNFVSSFIGKPIASMNDLTKAQASQLIEHLTKAAKENPSDGNLPL